MKQEDIGEFTQGEKGVEKWCLIHFLPKDASDEAKYETMIDVPKKR